MYRNHRRWAVLFASSYAFVAFAFSLQSMPPLIGAIMQEYSIDNAQAGLLMSSVVMPGIFLAIPAGILIERYGIRIVGSISSLLVALGSLVTAVAGSFAMVLIGRFIIGIGGAFITTVTPTIIPQWFPREELGRATGLYGLGMPIATVLAFPSASSLMLKYGWHRSIYLSIAIAALNAVLYTILMKEGPLRGERNRGPGVRSVLVNAEVWKVGIIWLLFNAAALSFTTWGPNILQDYRGMSPISSSFLASSIMLVEIPCVPAFGLLSDRMRRRKSLMVIGCAVMAGALVLMAYSSGMALIASIVIMGTAASLIPPVVMALPSEILGPPSAAIGFGIVALCLSAGIALGPPFIGYLLDATGSPNPSFLAMGLLSALGALVAHFLRSDMR
jgi:MFS family permease